MNKNSALYLLLVSAVFVFAGSVILLVLTADGALRLEGVGLGAGLGLWLGLAFLIGRAVYGERKNAYGLVAFMLLALIAGLAYQFVWLLPYMSAHRSVSGLFELLGGMVWALSFAAVYLSLQDYRRAGS